MTSKVAVLGAGAWGTALAFLLADKGDDVVLWSRRPELSQAINTAHENARYLPGIPLPQNLRSTPDLGDAMAGATMTVFVVPSHGTREVARAAAPHVHEGVPIVSATKGIENDSLMFMDEVLAQELPATPASRWRSCRVQASPRSSSTVCPRPSSSPGTTPTSART